MFTKHLLKVIIGFFGMIIFGLVSLVAINHYKSNDEKSTNVINVTPATELLSKPQISKKPTTKSPIKKAH